MDDRSLNRWGNLCSIVSLLLSLIGFLTPLGQPSTRPPELSGLRTLELAILLGLLTAVAYGVLWSVAERVFGWQFGAGGGDSRPCGWAAVALSLTLTIPLISIPPLYSRLAHIPLVAPGHILAGIGVVVASAAGHLFLYGSELLKFLGVKNLIVPAGITPSLKQALWSKAIDAVVHFGTIVVMYRVVVASRLGPLDAAVFYPALPSAALWFTSFCVFVFIRYPDSLADKRWIQVRGVINGAVLAIALQGGMLM